MKSKIAEDFKVYLGKHEMKHIPSQREKFDVPSDIAYLNCAYYSPQPKMVRDALIEGAAHKSSPWLITPNQFFDDVEGLRVLLAKALGGNSEGYAIVPSASYGVATAARILEETLGPGDEILILAEEFPSLYLPLERAARQTGAEIVIAPSGQGSLTEVLLDRLGPRTRIVATGQCHWTGGQPIDLHSVSAAAKAVGAALIVDASQTLGAVPFDFDGIDADFVTAAGYKWLLCPYGFSVLHVAERWWDSRPLEESWLARTGSDDFANLINYSDLYRAGARRFDVSEACCPTITWGAAAAIDLLASWGVDNIEASLKQLNKRLAAIVSESGMKVSAEAERMAHMFGARLPNGQGTEVVQRLRTSGVIVSQRGSSIRFSPHLHVNDDDISRVSAVLLDC